MSDEMRLTQADNEHIDRRFDEILRELRMLNGAFARNEDGSVDFEGHRRYHEEMMAAARAQTEFWRELRLDIAKKGVWSLIIVALGLIAVGASAKLGLTK